MSDSKLLHLRKLLGAAIRVRRLERAWSQEKFAEQACLHRTYVGDIERGERNISLENLWRISEAFQISISDLFMSVEADAGVKGEEVDD